MAKKTVRKPTGAAAIQTIEDDFDRETNGTPAEPAEETPKPKRTAKVKAEPQLDGNFGIGDIKKAATFANSVGGLDKAIALLQILKVAKDVQ